MIDIPGWLAAIGALSVLVIGAVLSPLFKFLTPLLRRGSANGNGNGGNVYGQQISDLRDDFNDRLDAQDGRINAIGAKLDDCVRKGDLVILLDSIKEATSRLGTVREDIAALKAKLDGRRAR